MGKLGMVNRILLLVALLVCNAYGGSTVMLTAILPINKDINAPLATAQVVAAIDMGIEAVNQQHIINSSFGVTLSVSFRDDQGSTKLALQETVRAATESPTKGIIGGYYSSTCEVISIVADEYGIPQVSGSATISDLSDKSFYPMFARTVPPDNEQAITIARLITLYGWSNVGVLYTTDLYATGMQQNFQIACGQAGINLLAQEQFATGGQLSVVKTLLSVIQQRNIKIIVLFMQSNDALTVFQGASDLEMLDADHAWIGSDSLESLDIPSNLTHKLQGFMYTVATTSNGSNYNQFEQQLLARVPSPRSQYAASYYDIVFVYAYAINALLTRHGSYYDFNGTELYNAILAVEFNGASRHIQFNANGDSYPALYSIYNFQNVSFVDVGLLSPNSTVPPKAIFFGGTTNPPSDDVRVNIINIALMLPFSTFENEITYKSAIAYVIDQLNAQNFVPNYTLVLISEDDKNNPGIGIVNAVYLADKGIPLLLGSDSSSVTKPIASVMSNLQIPQLSFISTSPELSDKGTYPYFLRNVPSDNAQTIAMASILKNFGWTRVITVNTVEAYGSAAVQAFNNATKSYGITSIYGASFQVGQLDLSGIMQDIAKQDATIIVTFVSYDDCPKFYSEVKRAGLMVSPYVWINSDTCSSWGRSFNASAFDEDPSLGEAMKGMLGVIAHSGGGQVYTDWVAEMASLKPDEYPGLSDVASVVYTSQSYDMMHLVATALRNMVLVGADYTDGPTLLSYLKNTTYQGLTGLNEFNSDGDRISDYDLLSWASTNSTQYSVVGLWQVADSKLSIFNQLSWLGTDLTYPSYIPPDRIPPSPEKKNSNNKIIIILASVLGFLLLAAIALIAFFLMRRRKIHIQEKEKIPALIWEDEPLLGASAGSDNSPMLTASPSVSSDVARFIPTNGIDINKVDLTFGLSKGDRFPVDKKLRDQVEITNTSNSVKKFRVYVPADVSRFRCQVYPGTGELRKNETLTFEIKFTLLLTTHINRKIKIEIDDNAPIYLSMNFKGDVSDKIDLDEIDIKGEPIGEGGFGTVYRGRFRGTEVAVKIAHSRNEHIKSFMNEFMREIDMMRRLHHPNITTFIGASFVPGKTGIVTEYCKRGSLAKLIHSGKSIPYGLKIKIAQDIANGVSFLHENGVLHRDLKPDNVLLASTNYMEQVCAKLTDFGTAKSVDQHTLNFAHTQGLGTPIYMSPEILQRKQYSTKVDVFSFGVLLWELYTQLHPFHFIKLHWNIPAFVLAGNRNPIPPDCPPELENLINRCWAAEADDRPTFQQIGETLDRIYQPLKKQEKVKSALGKLNREDDENGSSNSSPSSSPHPTNTGASIVHPTITSDSSVSHSHANVTSNSTAVFHPSISSNSAAVHPSATVKEYLREIELETVHNTNSNNNAL